MAEVGLRRHELGQAGLEVGLEVRLDVGRSVRLSVSLPSCCHRVRRSLA